ncbi:MAG TPA: c-type cytochrome, partial [Bryobacteraceae bacterium]|nr:c-type cytochrome [Bryobacteraceae bacterium]
MNRPALVLIFLSIICVPLRAATPKAEAAARVFAANCAGCHSAQAKSSDFSVATLDAVIAGGKKHGRSVVGGHPEQSPLVKILKGEVAPQMPMGKALAAADIAAVEAWIRELPAEKIAASKDEWRWPYEKPVKRTPPAVTNAAWVKNPIDSFILSKLEENKLKPAPKANK